MGLPAWGSVRSIAPSRYDAATAYLTVEEVPESLTQSVPYVATLVVLATATKRLRPPAQAGIKFRPGEGH